MSATIDLTGDDESQERSDASRAAPIDLTGGDESRERSDTIGSATGSTRVLGGSNFQSRPPGIQVMKTKHSATAAVRPAPTNSIHSQPRPAKKAKSKKDSPHVLLWICTHGKGQSRTWTKKSLRVIGVYPTKAAAENKKEDVMSQHERCGHGDILVGGCWDDEIDLLVRPVEEMDVEKAKANKDSPHVLLWICTHGKGQSKTWTKKALRVIGAYHTKEATENKKEVVMSQHECCGHGDIVVGDCWDDEIDLLVRRIEEMDVDA
jgi:hypothetical protein